MQRLSIKLFAEVSVVVNESGDTVDQEAELEAEFDCTYDYAAKCCEFDNLTVRINGEADGYDHCRFQVLQDAIDVRLEQEAARINAERATRRKLASDTNRALDVITGQAELDREQAGAFKGSEFGEIQHLFVDASRRQGGR